MSLWWMFTYKSLRGPRLSCIPAAFRHGTVAKGEAGGDAQDKPILPLLKLDYGKTSHPAATRKS